MKYEARQKGYKVLGELRPDQVLPYTGPDACNQTFFGRQVKMTSLRYQTFRKSIRCVCCGVEGTVMLLELPGDRGMPHFNLYAEREGKLVQMTKDHKQPKSKGGLNTINNMQTMCCHCNELKGDRHLKGGNKKILRGLRKIRDGSQAIYIVTPGQYMEDKLEGFATTYRGIARLVERHLERLYYPEKVKIQVDMGEMCVIIEEEYGLKYNYVIHKIERV
jgi:5-methylcytosine-specific restriction endonuclease McrA